MNFLAGAVTLALGVFVTFSPERAARVWGRQLDTLAPAGRVLYLRCYRAFGVTLCLAGVLFAVETIMYPN